MMHKFESAVGLAVSIAIDAVSKLATTLPILSEIESDFTSEGFHRVLVILRGASKRRPGNRLVRGLFTVYVYVLVESAGYPVLARLRKRGNHFRGRNRYPSHRSASRDRLARASP